MRIVSLLPSATEIICSLGLSPQLVGVTHECDYPAEVRNLPKVTRTLIPSAASSAEIDSLVRERLQTDKALYSLDLPKLQELQPDLIVTQALCDVCAVAEAEVAAAARLVSPTTRVLNLEPHRLEDVFASMYQVAAAADRIELAIEVVDALKERVASVERRSRSLEQRPTTLLLEWIDPPFCAGHWNPELVALAGGRGALGVAGRRSATTTWEDIFAADPEVLIIACCGFDVARALEDLPLLRAQPGWRGLRCVQTQRVYVADGSAYFNRPGPRLVDSLEILAAAIHPEHHPLPARLEPALRLDVRDL